MPRAEITRTRSPRNVKAIDRRRPRAVRPRTTNLSSREPGLSRAGIATNPLAKTSSHSVNRTACLIQFLSALPSSQSNPIASRSPRERSVSTDVYYTNLQPPRCPRGPEPEADRLEYEPDWSRRNDFTPPVSGTCPDSSAGSPETVRRLASRPAPSRSGRGNISLPSSPRARRAPPCRYRGSSSRRGRSR